MSMCLAELQDSSDLIATLLDRLEEGVPLDSESRVGSKASVGSKATQEEEPRNRRRQSAKAVVEHTKAQNSSAHFESERDEAESQASSGGDDDFLKFEPSELGGAFDSFNIAGSKKMIDELFGRVKAKERVSKTHAISQWFNNAALVCRDADAELDETESTCIEEFKYLEATADKLFSSVETRDLNCIQFMRKFYRKVVSLRPEAAGRRKQKQKEKQKRNLSYVPEQSRSESKEKLAKEDRRRKLYIEIEEDNKEARRARGEDGDALAREDTEEVNLIGHRSSGQKDIGKTFGKGSVGGSHRASDARGSLLSPRSSQSQPQIRQGEIASELLEVISAQQDEIANFRSRTEVDEQKAEALKAALDYLTIEHDNEEAEAEGKKRKRKHIDLGEMGKEALNGVIEEMRLKCIGEMLLDAEGRELLSQCTNNIMNDATKSRIQAAQTRAATIMEDTENLKSQMEQLQDQIDAVGSREDREEQLRVAIAAAKEAKELELQQKKEADSSPKNSAPAASAKKGKKGKKSKIENITAEGSIAASASEPAAGAAPAETQQASPEAAGQPVEREEFEVHGPKAGWMSTQPREIQIQLNTVCRSVERMMESIHQMTGKLRVAVDQAVQAAVDERTAQEKEELSFKPKEGSEDVANNENDEAKRATIARVRSTMKDNQTKLEDSRDKMLKLMQEESEQQQALRKLKRIQRDEDGEFIESRHQSPRDKREPNKQASANLETPKSATDDKKSSTDDRGAAKKLMKQSSLLLKRKGNKAKTLMILVDSDGEEEGPPSQDIHEVRDKAQEVVEKIEALEKLESEMKAKMEAIIWKRHSTKSTNSTKSTKSKADLTERGGATAGGAKAGSNHAPSISKAASGLQSPRQSPRSTNASVVERTAGPAEGGTAGAIKVQEGGLQPNSPLQRENIQRADSVAVDKPGSTTDDGGDDQAMVKDIMARMGKSNGQGYTGDDGRRRSNDGGIIARQGTSTLAVPRSNTRGTLLGGEQQDANSNEGGNISQGNVATTVSGSVVVQSSVVVDKREQQVKELLFYQSERERLNDQIVGIDRQIREAKIRNAQPGGGQTGVVTSASVKDTTVPPENRAMRREVVRRQRELNALRKNWHAESDKHKRGAYDGNVPGQVEAAVKLLLRDPPNLAQVQAKAEEEAVQRAREEAAKLAAEEAAEEKETTGSKDAADTKAADAMSSQESAPQEDEQGQDGLCIVGEEHVSSRSSMTRGVLAKRRLSRKLTAQRSSLQNQIADLKVQSQKRASAEAETVASLMNESVHRIGPDTGLPTISSGDTSLASSSRTSLAHASPGELGNSLIARAATSLHTVKHDNRRASLMHAATAAGWHDMSVQGQAKDESAGSSGPSSPGSPWKVQRQRSQAEPGALTGMVLAGHHIDPDSSPGGRRSLAHSHSRPIDRYDHIIESVAKGAPQQEDLGLKVHAAHRRGEVAPMQMQRKSVVLDRDTSRKLPTMAHGDSHQAVSAAIADTRSAGSLLGAVVSGITDNTSATPHVSSEHREEAALVSSLRADLGLAVGDPPSAFNLQPPHKRIALTSKQTSPVRRPTVTARAGWNLVQVDEAAAMDGAALQGEKAATGSDSKGVEDVPGSKAATISAGSTSMQPEEQPDGVQQAESRRATDVALGARATSGRATDVALSALKERLSKAGWANRAATQSSLPST